MNIVHGILHSPEFYSCFVDTAAQFLLEKKVIMIKHNYDENQNRSIMREIITQVIKCKTKLF